MPRVIHFEILSKDSSKATQFYKDALGWKINAWEMPGQTYWLAGTGAKTEQGIDGAIMDIGQFNQPVINTLETKNIRTAQAKIEKAGGQLVQGPYPIPNVGLHAYFRDPEGILFGVLQPPKSGAMQQQASAAPAAKRSSRKPSKSATKKKRPAAKRATAKSRR